MDRIIFRLISNICSKINKIVFKKKYNFRLETLKRNDSSSDGSDSKP